MLKEPNEIENYQEKAKFLEENGWVTFYHYDNWVKVEWYDHPTIDVSRAGYSTDGAYNKTMHDKDMVEINKKNEERYEAFRKLGEK